MCVIHLNHPDDGRVFLHMCNGKTQLVRIKGRTDTQRGKEEEEEEVGEEAGGLQRDGNTAHLKIPDRAAISGVCVCVFVRARRAAAAVAALSVSNYCSPRVCVC